jgi:hypothetical protein
VMHINDQESATRNEACTARAASAHHGTGKDLQHVSVQEAQCFKTSPAQLMHVCMPAPTCAPSPSTLHSSH